MEGKGCPASYEIEQQLYLLLSNVKSANFKSLQLQNQVRAGDSDRTIIFSVKNCKRSNIEEKKKIMGIRQTRFVPNLLVDESYVLDGAQRPQDQRIDQPDRIAAGPTTAEQRPYPSDRVRGVPAVPTRFTI